MCFLCKTSTRKPKLLLKTLKPLVCQRVHGPVSTWFQDPPRVIRSQVPQAQVETRPRRNRDRIIQTTFGGGLSRENSQSVLGHTAGWAGKWGECGKCYKALQKDESDGQY